MYNVGAHPRIDPGLLVPQSDTLTTRLQGQVTRFKYDFLTLFDFA